MTTFGYTTDDITTALDGVTPVPGVALYVWAAETGGTPVLDILSGLDGAFGWSEDVDVDGRWVSAGLDGKRWWVEANEALASLRDRVDTTETRVGGVEDELPKKLDVTAANSTYATGGQVRSKVKTDNTDQTATLQAELNGLHAAGGGTLVLPAGDIRLDGQVIFPNDGGGIFPTGAQLQRTMTIAGQGGYHSGQQATTYDTGGTRLVCNYTNATYNNAKLVTRGLGRLNIRDIVFVSKTANDATPFLYTTNTTLHVSGCAFMGATQGTACQLDAIVLGGTKKKPNGVETGYNDPDSAFQGYGTVVTGNYFDRVRRVVYGRSYCNHTVTSFNFVEKTCGTNLAGGACIEFNGNLDVANGSVQPGDYCTGNQVYGNYMNGLGYAYQVKLTQATRCVIFGNGSPDPQTNIVALVGCFSGVENSTTYPSTQNQVIANHSQAAPVHLSEDAGSAGLNTVIGGMIPEGTKLRGNVAIEPGSQNPAQIGKVNFTGPITSSAAIHEWTISDPKAGGTAANPWKVTGGGIDWLVLTKGTNPALFVRGSVNIEGNAGSGAGSSYLTIGNNAVASDAQITLNPPTGQNSTIQFKYAGANKWQIYNGAGNDLYIRDMAGAVMALQFITGAGVTGQAKFSGTVKTGAAATASRPSASTAGAGAMFYDTTLGKPIWSNGTAWTDATGTVV